MIKVITNSMGSGDWITVEDSTGEVLFNGHSIGAQELVHIINSILDPGAKLIEVTDERMEEGDY